MKTLLCAVAIVAGIGPAVAGGVDLTPLHGRWDPSRQNCAARGTVGDISFELSDEGLLWYESSCRFRSVRKLGIGPALQADPDCDGEGEKWTTEMLLMPSNDGELLMYFDHGEGYLATRCGD